MSGRRARITCDEMAGAISTMNPLTNMVVIPKSNLTKVTAGEASATVRQLE